jgi:hypothetical protein
MAKMKKARYRLNSRLSLYIWWLGAESNCRHADFQSAALPTELPSRQARNYSTAFLRLAFDAKDFAKNAALTVAEMRPACSVQGGNGKKVDAGESGTISLCRFLLLIPLRVLRFYPVPV